MTDLNHGNKNFCLYWAILFTSRNAIQVYYNKKQCFPTIAKIVKDKTIYTMMPNLQSSNTKFVVEIYFNIKHWRYIITQQQEQQYYHFPRWLERELLLL